ncbi:MAG TPA: DNA-3-methyladenine glycosylase I [Candidatus Dormibacteraeota bacterium]
MSSQSGISIGADGTARCWWCDSDDLYRRYHDLEWGRPVADDRRLFEKLSLEAFMSGLSWLTILRKRENFRAAFRNFDPSVVARFTARDVGRLMGDAGIVRNRAKIEATVNNARRYSLLLDEFGTFAAYAWRFEPKPRKHLLDHTALMQLDASEEAGAMSKDLRRRGWAFVGPTTVYSFIQAMGLVNDHVKGCAAGAEVEQLRRSFVRPAVKR